MAQYMPGLARPYTVGQGRADRCHIVAELTDQRTGRRSVIEGIGGVWIDRPVVVSGKVDCRAELILQAVEQNRNRRSKVVNRDADTAHGHIVACPRHAPEEPSPSPAADPVGRAPRALVRR